MSATAMESEERLICKLLLGEAAAWPGTRGRVEISRFIDLLEFHGAAPLVARALANGDARESWPAAILDYCRDQSLARAVSEMAGREEIARVLQALADAGIKSLLLKGGSLAYSHYANPVLRPRGDTDLLVPPHDRRPAEDVLRRLGYAQSMQMAGEFISYQANWAFTDRVGVVHDLDLHWRVNNSQVLAKLLDFDELAARATGVAALGMNARALAPVHALLFACMHLAGHRHAPIYLNGIAHPAGERLIWLYDIHLLASAMPPAELEEFAVLAARKRMACLCREALEKSAECFRTRIPESVMQRLSPAGALEPSARYCSAGPARQMVDDLRALDGVGARAQLLGEMLFPSKAYMRNKYTGAAVTWLPFLYARRAAQAICKMTASRPASRTARRR
jgi:hypothetical protein